MARRELGQIFFFLMAVAWGHLIFYLSSLPDLSSGLPTLYDWIFRKLAHITVFAVLTYLLARSLDKKNDRYLLFVIVVAIFYAWLDEIHQTAVAHRQGSPLDIIIDSGGVFWGAWLYQEDALSGWFKK